MVIKFSVSGKNGRTSAVFCLQEKEVAIPDELGRDAQTVAALQRRHANFEHDLITLGAQVQSVQEEAAKLIVAYSGDKARDIQDREAEVVNAWRNLQIHVEGRKNRLADASDLYRFFGMVRDLMNWMQDMCRQMGTQEKPRWVSGYIQVLDRCSIFGSYSQAWKVSFMYMVYVWWACRDVSGVELLMNNHQSLKAEIDSRDENFTITVNLGKDLLARKHHRSQEVREKLIQLGTNRGGMMDQWEERWEYLQLSELHVVSQLGILR